MQAIVLDAPGGPEVLRLREVPDPVPGPEEVLVDVVSTAVNRADVLQRMGMYPYPGRKPAFDIPGLELAGRVAAVGERVTLWQPGDRVMGIVTGGGYATRAAVHERQLVRVPDALDLADAGAIPEVWITAFDALVLRCGMRAGDIVLVHAGASGVGTAAIQLAAAAGAHVTASVRNEALRDAVSALGADVVLDPSESAGAGPYDVLLELVGAPDLQENLGAMRRLGRVVVIGVGAGFKAEVNLLAVMGQRLRIGGSTLRARPLEEKATIVAAVREHVWPLITESGNGESGTVRPVIQATYPLADAAAAHRDLEASQHIGKLLLLP